MKDLPYKPIGYHITIFVPIFSKIVNFWPLLHFLYVKFILWFIGYRLPYSWKPYPIVGILSFFNFLNFFVNFYKIPYISGINVLFGNIAVNISFTLAKWFSGVAASLMSALYNRRMSSSLCLQQHSRTTSFKFFQFCTIPSHDRRSKLGKARQN